MAKQIFNRRQQSKCTKFASSWTNWREQIEVRKVVVDAFPTRRKSVGMTEHIMKQAQEEHNADPEEGLQTMRVRHDTTQFLVLYLRSCETRSASYNKAKP
jgi:hypothetical protein